MGYSGSQYSVTLVPVCHVKDKLDFTSKMPRNPHVLKHIDLLELLPCGSLRCSLIMLHASGKANWSKKPLHIWWIVVFLYTHTHELEWILTGFCMLLVVCAFLCYFQWLRLNVYHLKKRSPGGCHVSNTHRRHVANKKNPRKWYYVK